MTQSDESATPVANNALAGGRTPAGDRRLWVQTGILVLLALFMLRAGRDVLIPITLALMAHAVLGPVVTRLTRWRVPRTVGAGLMTLLLAAVIGAFVYGAVDASTRWLQKAPEWWPQLRAQASSDLSEVKQAADALEKIAEEEGSKAVVIQSQPPVKDRVVSGVREAATITSVTLLLLYFLLSTGDLMLARSTALAPSFGARKRLVRAARAMQKEIATYLVNMTWLNLGVAILTSLGLWLAGIPDAFVWGGMAGLLRFIPYLGNVVTVGVLTALGAITYDTLWWMLAPPAIYLVFVFLYGNIFELIVHGQSLALNPVMIFVAVVFWGSVWGVVGALIAVPLLAGFKVLCEQIPSLRPVGRLVSMN